LIFMLHPQHTYAATVKHLLLGGSLIIGAPLCIRAKTVAWKFELDSSMRSTVGGRNNLVDWSMIAAGGCFTFAACVLLAFREKESPIHVGTTIDCQPSFVVCAISYACAGLSIIAATIAAIRHEYTARKQANAPLTASAPGASSRSSTYCCSRFLRAWRLNAGWSRVLQSGDHEEDVDLGDSASESPPSTRRYGADPQLELTDVPSLMLTVDPVPSRMARIAQQQGGGSPSVCASVGELDDYSDEPEIGDLEDVLRDDLDRHRDHRRQEEYTG
jgi:hypothetical protein